jgi:hypothetical protein
MSLINYTEPFSMGDMLLGVGGLIFMLMLTYLIYRLYRIIYVWAENYMSKDIKYSIIEETMLNELAKEKNIDLDMEIAKRQILIKPNKSFRSKIEEEVFNRMFIEDSE